MVSSPASFPGEEPTPRRARAMLRCAMARSFADQLRQRAERGGWGRLPRGSGAEAAAGGWARGRASRAGRGGGSAAECGREGVRVLDGAKNQRRLKEAISGIERRI